VRGEAEAAEQQEQEKQDDERNHEVPFVA